MSKKEEDIYLNKKKNEEFNVKTDFVEPIKGYNNNEDQGKLRLSSYNLFFSNIYNNQEKKENISDTQKIYTNETPDFVNCDPFKDKELKKNLLVNKTEKTQIDSLNDNSIKNNNFIKAVDDLNNKYNLNDIIVEVKEDNNNLKNHNEKLRNSQGANDEFDTFKKYHTENRSTQDKSKNLDSIQGSNIDNNKVKNHTYTNENGGETVDPNKFQNFNQKLWGYERDDPFNILNILADDNNNDDDTIHNKIDSKDVLKNNYEKDSNSQDSTKIEITKLLSYDLRHNDLLNLEYKFENLGERKKNFINDIFYSLLPFSKFENIEQFNKSEEYEEDTLSFEVKTIINEIINANKIIKKEISEDLNRHYSLDKYSQNYLYNITPCFKLYIMEKFWNDIECLRRGKNDGDSFYKCFMFSLLEKYIVYKKTLKLKSLIYEIFSQIDKNDFTYRNVEIIKEETLIILDIIIKYIEENNIRDSIDFLNKSFCSNDNFCNSMVKYMKIKLANFIKENEKLFNFNELLSNKIISKIFFVNNLFQCSNYIDQKVLIMKSEPDLFIYLITPLALKANLKLFVNESSGKKQLIHENIVFENEIIIDLLYIKRSYSIFYRKNYFRDNLQFYNISDEDIFNINEFKGTPNMANDKKDINYDAIKIELSVNKQCKDCGKEANKIFLDKICPNFPICQSCLKINTDKVISNRLTNLIKDGFENIEYYTRSINLTPESDKRNLILSSLEFKFLYGISETIYSQMINNSCLKCRIIFQDNNHFKMDCGCKFCYDCINKIIEKSEKNFLSTYQPEKCNCGILDINKVIDKRFTEAELNKYKEEAYQRLTKFWNQYCMICAKESKKNNDQNKEDNLLEIEIKKEQGERAVQVDNQNHKICKKCAILEGNKLIKQHKKDEDICLECKLCHKSHLIRYNIFKQIINKSKKEKISCTCSII